VLQRPPLGKDLLLGVAQEGDLEGIALRGADLR
jgi:hypothetical protein